MTMHGSPIDVRPLFPAERAALLDLLADLSATDWQRPTACPGWSAHGVALHLLGGDVNVLAGGRDAFHGPPASPTLDLSN